MIKVVTHDGEFHSDEIFACVLLIHFLEADLDIIRTRNNDILSRYLNDKDSYAIDVGSEYNPNMLNFDHHQQSFNMLNDAGNLMSSCGLIWKHIKENCVLEISDYVKAKIDSFVDSIDKQDNGIEYFKDLDFISVMNKSSDDNKFYKALDFALFYFESKLTGWKDLYERELKSELALSRAIDGIIFSHDKLSVTTNMNLTDNYVLLSKRKENEWCINSLNEGKEIDFSIRCSPPDSWKGLSGDELCKVSGFSGMVFCHKSGFITIVNGTFEEAFKVAKYIVDNHRKV